MVGNLSSSGFMPTSFNQYGHQPSELYMAYLHDPTVSVLKIRLSGATVYANRKVLCRGSEYFTKMLTGRFQVSMQSFLSFLTSSD